MISAELIRSAWDGLKSHKVRSGLTTLGIIFGVAAVIGMASIGEGARREALSQIERMGVGNIIIDEDRPTEGDDLTTAMEKNPRGLTLQDADALSAIITEARRIVPIRSAEPMVSGEDKPQKINVVATRPDYFDLYDLNVNLGRELTWLDETEFRRVCVLGFEARRKLFPLKNPLGETIRIYGNSGMHEFAVVGVIDRRLSGGENIKGLDLRNENLDIYVPLETSLKREPPGNSSSELSQIIVQLSNPENLNVYAGLIDRLLNRRHREVQDYKVIVPEELLRQHQATQRIFNIVMGTIASISLLVGGIGIMNIMLASVLERTREIGIRRAIGAKQSDIARQFLMEAVLLSVSGGIIGVIVGVALSFGINMFAEWETAVSLWSILVAVGVSAGVGIIFGYLPARKAAKLDPITALRFE